MIHVTCYLSIFSKMKMLHDAQHSNMTLCNLQTTQAQISLCISTQADQCLHCLLSEYCIACRQTENAQIRLHGCICLSGSMLSANCIRAFFVCCASYYVTIVTKMQNISLCLNWHLNQNEILYFLNQLSCISSALFPTEL